MKKPDNEQCAVCGEETPHGLICLTCGMSGDLDYLFGHGHVNNDGTKK